MDMNDHVISKADLWADRIHAFQESGLLLTLHTSYTKVLF